MKKLLLILFILPFAAFAQTPQTSYVVPTVSAMKSYYGAANRIYVVEKNSDYVQCISCTPDEVNIYAGAGGRKWMKFSDSAKADVSALADSAQAIRSDFPSVTGVTQAQLDDTAQAIRSDFPSGGTTDTTSLSNRIDAKLNISDTAAMLAPYRGGGGSGDSFTTQTYTTGSSVTISDASNWLIVNPSALKDSLTIIMPANPTDREEVSISFGGTITGGNDVVTNLTISPNTGQTLVGNYPPTYFQSGESVKYRYNLSTTKWYAQ